MTSELAIFLLFFPVKLKTEISHFETILVYPVGNGSIVLVELEATERSPGMSPTKIYSPLEVVYPAHDTSNPGPSTSVLPHTNAEKFLIPKTSPAEDRDSNAFLQDNDSSVIVLKQTCEGIEHHIEHPPCTAQTEDTQDETCETPPPTMHLLPGDMSQELLEGIIAAGSSHVMSSPFSRYILHRSHEEEITSPQSHLVEPELVTQANLTKTPTQILVIDEEGRPPEVNPGRISITRSEKLTLSRVLDQLPPGLLQGEGVEWDQPISVMVTNVPEGDQTNLTRTYNPNVAASSRMPVVTYPPTTESSFSRGNRQRPKYSLKTHMLRKLPVLKFSATGPLDKEKTPFKWWCRVCKLELSLMSRDVLELMSHYRTEDHLVKEHRIRMELPGMPLFDRDEQELLGIPLSEAKKKAKDTYPIAPQLDPCRPLVNQASVSDLGSHTSPSEEVLSQVCILEFGLRFGGHFNSLNWVHDELVRHIPSAQQPASFNWSEHRNFVSIFLFILV